MTFSAVTLLFAPNVKAARALQVGRFKGTTASKEGCDRSFPKDSYEFPFSNYIAMNHLNFSFELGEGNVHPTRDCSYLTGPTMKLLSLVILGLHDPPTQRL